MTPLSFLRTLAPVVALLALAGCGSTPTYMSDSQCLSMANALQTLRMGDELPRVIQVMGKPARTYRVRGSSFLGHTFDVLAYETTGTACSRIVLDSPRELHLMFDEHGRLVSMGNAKFFSLQKATDVRTNRVDVNMGGIR